MARPSHSAFSEPPISGVGISGSDDGGPAPGERTVVMPFASRSVSVVAQSRIVSPLAFDRSVSPFAVSRVIRLPVL